MDRVSIGDHLQALSFGTSTAIEALRRVKVFGKSRKVVVSSPIGAEKKSSFCERDTVSSLHQLLSPEY
jgi:hypothetical protein